MKIRKNWYEKGRGSRKCLKLIHGTRYTGLMVNYCIEILKTTDNKTVLFQLLYQLLKILSRYFFIHDISCLANFSAMWL